MNFKKMVLASVSLALFTGVYGTGGAADAASKNDLRFDENANYTVETQMVDGEAVTYRAYKNIPYVAKPADPRLEVMNIYIPAAYFEEGAIGNYTRDTAPIFFPNGVGGYMESMPLEPVLGGGRVDGEASRLGGVSNEDSAKMQKPNAALMALSKGYVVASAGARGRETKDAKGKYIGKAPAGIVDLKAAVAYLHFNDENMAGDANKIISNGTSAGGAMSVLLGATGDNKEYRSYLKKLGAAKASNSVYAVSAYCPITNLEMADAAYEWQMQGIDSFEKREMKMVDGKMERSLQHVVLSDEEKAVSAELANAFEQSVDTFEPSYRMRKIFAAKAREGIRPYVKENIPDYALVGTDGMVGNVYLDKYFISTGRSKGVPAFDAFDLSSAENSLFGSEKIPARHFTKYSKKHDVTRKGKMADPQQIRLMNPMHYLGEEKTVQADKWRIRVGMQDTDTSFMISAMLAEALEKKANISAKNIDLDYVWGVGHSGDYDLDELFSWMDSISK